MTTNDPAAPPPAPVPFDPVPLLAEELALPASSVGAVVRLLAEGATVPFISRYRKEATGGLDEVQVRTIEERRTYLVELDERRGVILAEIGRQGKLTGELEAKLRACRSKTELEDLYVPFKPKRRTRAMIARERGLGLLAERLWSQPLDGSPDTEAAAFVDAAKEVPDVAAALAGARDICAEQIAEDAPVRALVREAFTRDGMIRVSKEKAFLEQVTKFDTYGDFTEALRTIPSHRYLAIRRGEAEGVLRVAIDVDADLVVPAVARAVRVNRASPWADELTKAVQDAWKRLLVPSIQGEVRVESKRLADRAAVDVFAQNLRQLLLAPPFGSYAVIGIDPGQRTGCKCVVVDATGKLLHHTVFHLVQGDHSVARAKAELAHLCKTHQPRAVAVGNGTHGRETEDFVREVLTAEKLTQILCIPVSEAGASVYSASDVAREEFPDHDLTVRGAVSIARRLQDPLAELVKIDPKSIGVGQYQHDVHQPLLGKKLDEVIESCVNAVGVEMNTASAPLLARVAGVGATAAKKIVAYRNENGPFRSRKALLGVPGIGPRTFEQAAGFLRVRAGEHPLDASAVHPERYTLVERMAADLNVPVASLLGNHELVRRLDASRYLAGDVGEFTFRDIVAELTKPGRDPRANFEAPSFRQDVRTMNDLTVGMELEGIVTNVTAFGAFVDVGVHQDGLVHVSQLADRFVKDPNDAVKVGDKLRVRVTEIDLVRKRIALSARQGEGSNSHTPGSSGQRGPRGQGAPPPRRPEKAQGAVRPADGKAFSNNPFEKLLRK